MCQKKYQNCGQHNKPKIPLIGSIALGLWIFCQSCFFRRRQKLDIALSDSAHFHVDFVGEYGNDEEGNDSGGEDVDPEVGELVNFVEEEICYFENGLFSYSAFTQ